MKLYQKKIEKFELQDIAKIDSLVQIIDKKTGAIDGINSISKAQEGEITFLHNDKYATYLSSSRASACIITSESEVAAPDSMSLIIHKNPYYIYAKLIDFMYQEKNIQHEYLMISEIMKFNHENNVNISEHALIDKRAIIGKNVTIMPNTIIAPYAEIGDNSLIGSSNIINIDVKIGRNAIIGNLNEINSTIIEENSKIGSGNIIGRSGFGFATNNGIHHNILHLGQVNIGNDVTIGSNCIIDRGSVENTVIEDHTRIDSMVQIGHNVKIGKGCIIVAQVGIAGSTILGNYVVVGGQVGIAGHLKIGDMVTIAAKSGVGTDLEANKKYAGIPAINMFDWKKISMKLKKMVTPG